MITSTNNLPDLPQTKKKREADITPQVLRWFRANHDTSCAIEVKASTGRSIPRSALKDHQRRALLDAKGSVGLAHKLIDARIRNPFDAFLLVNVPAYVVACFPKYGICKVIDVDKWDGANLSTPCRYTIDLRKEKTAG